MGTVIVQIEIRGRNIQEAEKLGYIVQPRLRLPLECHESS